MQWDTGPTAGFCPPNVQPWLPLDPDYKAYNVEVEWQDPGSMLSFFRKLIELRRAMPALSVGSYETVRMATGTVLADLRQDGGTRLLVVLNFGPAPQTRNFSALAPRGRVLLSTEMDRAGDESLRELTVRANEGIIVQLD